MIILQFFMEYVLNMRGEYKKNPTKSLKDIVNKSFCFNTQSKKKSEIWLFVIYKESAEASAKK